MKLTNVLIFCLDLFRPVLADIGPYDNSTLYQTGQFGLYPTQRFFSDASVVAPTPNIIVPRHVDHEKDYVTWAAHGRGINPTGPQLLDVKSLSVVYQAPLYSGSDSFGLSTGTCNGTDYLIYWSGKRQFRRTVGRYYILNSTYHVVWNISAVGFVGADAHSGFLTDDCQFVFTVYQPQRHDLESVGLYSDSWIMECYIQTVDLAIGKLIFQWRSTDHIPLEDALDAVHDEDRGEDGSNPWDFLHVNSVAKDHIGNYLVSARNTNTVYYISGISGNIIWQLGGSSSSFKDLSGGLATDFTCQHEAGWLNEDLTRMYIFDNRACTDIQNTDPVTRGIVLALNHVEMTVRLESHYRAPDNISSSRQGGMQVLTNGNIFLSFGAEPAFTEYSPSGSIVWDVRFGPIMLHKHAHTADNYRSTQLDWTGDPHWPPNIAAGPSLDGKPYAAASLMEPDQHGQQVNDTVYFSWNGATRLRHWLVLGSNSSLSPAVIETVSASGFETGLYIGSAARYAQVSALDGECGLLPHGVSAVFDMQNGARVDVRPESWVERIGVKQVQARCRRDIMGVRDESDVNTKWTIGQVGWTVATVSLVVASYALYIRRRVHVS